MVYANEEKGQDNKVLLESEERLVVVVFSHGAFNTLFLALNKTIAIT